MSGNSIFGPAHAAMRVQARALVVGLFSALGLALPAWSGDVSGRVMITKRLTPRRVTLASYELRGISLTPPAQSPALAAESTRVVIYLEGPGLPSGSPVFAQIGQKGRRFEPELLHVPAGSTVGFPNNDPIFHNVFSLSKAGQFDLGYYPEGRTRTVRFEKPGVVQVYCHIHPNMSTTILVVPSAWHTQPGNDGAFTLSDVPAGRYQIVAWHRSAGMFKRWIEIPASGSVEISMTIPLPEVAGVP